MRIYISARLALAATLFAFAGTMGATAQSTPAVAGGPFPLAPPPGTQVYPTPLTDSNDRFVSIFNGTSLHGWDGDSRYWRVEDHEVVGGYHLIVPGNVLIHILNGHVMCEVIDDDVVNRKCGGFIGVQVHVGPPMKIEYRTFLLKTLP